MFGGCCPCLPLLLASRAGRRRIHNPPPTLSHHHHTHRSPAPTPQALEKLSHDHPAALLRNGALVAVLQYVDFFQACFSRLFC